MQAPSGAAVAGHRAEKCAVPAASGQRGKPGAGNCQVPGIGIKRGVVHATAVIDQFAWCQAQKWGPSGSTELSSCGAISGRQARVCAVRGNVQREQRCGGRHGLRHAYAHDTNAAVAASYGSAGGVNTVTTLGPGEWLVRLRGPAPPGISFSSAARRWSVT